MFGIWSQKRTRKEPHPETGSMWINKGSELRSKGYIKKYKEVHGKDSEHLTEPFDPEVAVLAGEG